MIKEQSFKTMPKKERDMIEKLVMFLYFKHNENSTSDIAKRIGWSKSRVNSILNRNIGNDMIKQKIESLKYYEEIKHLIT